MAKIGFLFACVFNNATYNISQGRGVLSQTWLHLILRQPQYVLSADINILLWQIRKMKLREVVTYLKLLLVNGRIWVGVHFFPFSVLFLPIWYQQHTWEPLASRFTPSSHELAYLLSWWFSLLPFPFSLWRKNNKSSLRQKFWDERVKKIGIVNSA